MRAQSSSFRDRVSAVLGDGLVHEEYIVGFCVCLGKDRHTFLVGDEEGDDERWVALFRRSTVTVVLLL